MRKQFIAVETMQEAVDEAPWAAAIAKCTGGFRAYESLQEYDRLCDNSDMAERKHLANTTWFSHEIKETR